MLFALTWRWAITVWDACRAAASWTAQGVPVQAGQQPPEGGGMGRCGVQPEACAQAGAAVGGEVGDAGQESGIAKDGDQAQREQRASR
ncbi:hypothetical protein [Streptomyces lutosisoli]|uniref:Uncharacterized protein n=1 Tax=Streptomyces lutosisoli TaxID=2665721 RepID=A0ABW2VF94_9ACTN